MKKEYEEAKLQIIMFENNDIIATSEETFKVEDQTEVTLDEFDIPS